MAKKATPHYDVIQWVHRWNTDQILPPEAFVLLDKYMKENQIIALQREDWLLRFIKSFVAAWGLYLYRKYKVPTASSSVTKDGEKYVPPKYAIYISITEFMKKEADK